MVFHMFKGSLQVTETLFPVPPHRNVVLYVHDDVISL